MSKDEVIQRTIDLLKINLAEAEEVEITKAMVTELLQVNSLVFLQLLTEVEKEFDIHIDDDYWEYNKLSSIDKIADYVMRYNL